MINAFIKKIFVVTALCIISCACFVQNSYAQKKQVRMGYYSGYNIFGAAKEKAIKGLGQDSLIELSQKAKMSIKLVDLNIPIVDALSADIIDIAGVSVPLTELADSVGYSKYPYGYMRFALAAKNGKKVYYDDPTLINGKKVATFRGNSANKLFDAYLTKNNINVEYVYGDLNNYTELNADFYLIFSSIKNINEFEIVLNLGKIPLHLVVKKGNENLLEPLDEAFIHLSNQKNSQVSRDQMKFAKIDDKFKNRLLTRQEAALLEGKMFSVGFIANNPPYQYVDDKGNPHGLSVDVLNILAKKYNFNIRYVPYNMEDVERFAGFDTLDILISIKGSDETTRKFFQRTDPFQYIQMIMLIAYNEHIKSSKQIFNSKMKVGMLKNIAFDYSELSRTLPYAEIKHYKNFDGLLNSLIASEINAAIFTSPDAEYAHALTEKKGFLYPLGIELPINFYISHSLADTYLPIFNTMLANLSHHEIFTINFKHSADYSPVYNIKRFFEEHWIYIAMAVGIFFFVLIVVIASSQMHKKNEFLKLLHSDDLTCLISMRFFRIKLQKILQYARPNKYELIVLDIDYFRMVNKHYGMEVGTQVIRVMGDCLHAAFQDTEAILSRKHSEQFVIFKKINEGRDIKYIVSVLLENAIKTIVGKNFSLTMSVGIYPISNPHEEISDMMDFADIARKRGKAYHKFTYITFNEKMRHNFYETLNIVYRMESALRDEEFRVVFQPKVCFETLKIIGAEALVRWIPLDGEPIYPDKFIATMETDGFITQLDLYIFEKVCKFIDQNKNEYRIPNIAVNLSAVTLCEADIVEKLLAITLKYSVTPAQVEVELTESALNTLENAVIANISALKELGFSIAMDDFGTGESSLNRLSVSNVDVLKLDKSFLDFNHDSKRGHIVVERIIDLAKQLNMKIVSEGVETLQQALWLKELKCNMGQGYYFSRPISEEAFKELLKTDVTFELK